MLKRTVTLGAIAPLMFALVACSDAGSPTASAPAQADTSNASTMQLAASTDGATVMRGIFFGIGPAAALFPEVWATAQAEEFRKRAMSSTPAELADHIDQAAKILREEGSVAAADHSEQVAAALRSGAITPAQLDKSTTDASRSAQAESIIARIQAEEPAFLPWFLAGMRSGNPARVDSALRKAGAKIASFSFSNEPKTNVADSRGTVGWWWGPGDVAIDAEVAGVVVLVVVLWGIAAWPADPVVKDRFAHEAVVETLTSRFACANGCGSNIEAPLKQ